MHARIAEEAGAAAVMALERVPSDIRADGGVARMSHVALIEEICQAVTIPVMAKARIGHFVEAQILEAIGVDYIDESEVLTPADEAHHIDKRAFRVPFVCGCRDLGEALRRISEGAAMIRTKGEAGTGDIVEAVRHMRAVWGGIRRIEGLRDDELASFAKELGAPLELVQEVKRLGRLPVVNFSAGGVATPADAALMMQLGADGVFVGSGIFKSKEPAKMATAIVKAVTHFEDPVMLANGLTGDWRADARAVRVRVAAGGAAGGSRQLGPAVAAPTSARRPRIGVLALQGDFREHVATLAALDLPAFEVRTLEQLEAADGLIIPGGESTTIARLLLAFGLREPLRERIASGLPVWGTCAGAILLAQRAPGLDRPTLAVLDITVERNAFGRQLDSFEADFEIAGLEGGPFRGVFIRAPAISEAGPGVEVLARLDDGSIAACRDGALLATTFHPELTNDLRLHAMFAAMVEARLDEALHDGTARAEELSA